MRTSSSLPNGLMFARIADEMATTLSYRLPVVKAKRCKAINFDCFNVRAGEHEEHSLLIPVLSKLSPCQQSGPIGSPSNEDGSTSKSREFINACSGKRVFASSLRNCASEEEGKELPNAGEPFGLGFL